MRSAQTKVVAAIGRTISAHYDGVLMDVLMMGGAIGCCTTSARTSVRYDRSWRRGRTPHTAIGQRTHHLTEKSGGDSRMKGAEGTMEEKSLAGYEQILPEKIEERSFAIIEEELAQRGICLDPREAPVIKRVIHTTADFDHAESLVFSKDALHAGIWALRHKATVVTDTNMAKSGINRKKLERLGGQVLCFMADEDVAEAARAQGCTRAAASMEKAARLSSSLPGPVIVAIGNAPTALIRLYELIQEGVFAPALVIGVPVGFVNVVQSKELMLSRTDTPYIIDRGRKGGSNVAAAIVNAFVYQISEKKG